MRKLGWPEDEQSTSNPHLQLTADTASCKLFELCGFRFKEASKSRRHWCAIHFRSIACVDRVA